MQGAPRCSPSAPRHHCLALLVFSLLIFLFVLFQAFGEGSLRALVAGTSFGYAGRGLYFANLEQEQLVRSSTAGFCIIRFGVHAVTAFVGRLPF